MCIIVICTCICYLPLLSHCCSPQAHKLKFLFPFYGHILTDVAATTGGAAQHTVHVYQYFIIIYIRIRECVALSMWGWRMLPHPLNTKIARLFLLTGCLKALLRHTPARSSGFQVQDNFPVTVSTRNVAEQRLIKMALSYNIHHNSILSSDGFSLKWFYEEEKFKYQKIARVLAVCFSYRF